MQPGPAGGGGLSQAIYYAKNIASATANGNAVTVRFSAAAAFPDVRILEYSGLNPTSPLDVTAAAVGNSATSSSGTATTTSASELLVGANMVSTSTTGPGAGFTSRMITTPRRRYRRGSNRDRHRKLSGHCPPVVRRPLDHADGGIPRTIVRFSRSRPDYQSGISCKLWCATLLIDRGRMLADCW